MDRKARPSRDDDSGGTPLSLLAEFEIPTSARFLGRVRGGVERRLLVSHVANGLWFLPVTVVLQFVLVGLELLAPAKER